MDDFTQLTKELTAILDKDTKKQNGIYFTPATYRVKVMEFVRTLFETTPDHVLEPSFGSGEFINDIVKTFPSSKITGIELNQTLFERVAEAFESDTMKQNKDNVTLLNEDFIKFQSKIKYDLIVGNPPYVVVNSKTPDEFKSVTMGRPNLYCWFTYKCIGLLKDDGILAFVLPNSILNTSYYGLLRKDIVDRCEILDIIEFDKVKTAFQETDQSTIALILKNKKAPSTTQQNSSKQYVIEHDNNVVFSRHYQYINEMLGAYPTLKELGMSVKTGTVVWNQNKDNLVDDPDDGVLLIYSGNIKNGTFVPFDENVKNGKRQFVNLSGRKPTLKGPAILFNRGYGNSVYVFDMLFIDEDEYDEFYVENHLNVICATTDDAKANIKKVYEYLKSDNNRSYIEKFTGNGAMSATEVATMLPIVLE